MWGVTSGAGVSRHIFSGSSCPREGTVNGGKKMALIYPSQYKTRHWNGALQARLTRAPLERFLGTHRLKLATGSQRDSDNIARASVLIIECGLKEYFHDREEGLAESHHPMIGRLACVATRAVAALIQQPDSWRIPALLSAARLLTPWVGLNPAACASASSIHEFAITPMSPAALQADIETAEGVSTAITANDSTSIGAIARSIAVRLRSASDTSSPVRDVPEFSSRSA